LASGAQARLATFSFTAEVGSVIEARALEELFPNAGITQRGQEWSGSITWDTGASFTPGEIPTERRYSNLVTSATLTTAFDTLDLTSQLSTSTARLENDTPSSVGDSVFDFFFIDLLPAEEFAEGIYLSLQLTDSEGEMFSSLDLPREPADWNFERLLTDPGASAGLRINRRAIIDGETFDYAAAIVPLRSVSFIPAPGAAALLALGGGLVLRRQR
jgi:hypothetical protein